MRPDSPAYNSPKDSQIYATTAYIFFGLALLLELVQLAVLLEGCITSTATTSEPAIVAVFLFLSPVIVATSLAPLLVVSLIPAIIASKVSSRAQLPVIEQCKIATLIRGISFGVTINLFSLAAACAIIFVVVGHWLANIRIFSAFVLAVLIGIVITVFVRPLIQLRRISATSTPLRVPKLKAARIWTYVWLVLAILSLPYSLTLIGDWLSAFFR